ncbi:hypothetical protein CGLO_01071 [Colletotrichum gloeosporioides Cg-14]|uniref:Uncharacterized protein n=1 Tax=Colletotrichum gloeosporioides (strain Cg-14) TaxID=1237896 RepID=T0M531_COLGC|nr:hypothetical protein CGLO_01071 [Colletotrichum gloeosporioides Cg-14]
MTFGKATINPDAPVRAITQSLWNSTHSTSSQRLTSERTITNPAKPDSDTMRVLSLSLVVVAMAFVHSAAAKPKFSGGNMEENGNSYKKAMLDGNDTQLDMEVPLDENNWVNGDESAVPIANEQQGEAVKFEA